MNFGKLLEEVYAQCGLRVLRRVATGGSTTTVVDSGLANKKGDGYYAQGNNGGHILFLSQTTDRAAPEGQYGEVSAFTLSTSTPTFTIPTLTATAAAGDIYSVMKPTILLQEITAQCNEGLRRLPPLELVDTSLTTSANTLAYTLPFAVGQYELLGVEVGNDTLGWSDAPGFSVTPASGSTQDKLVFTSFPFYDANTPGNATIKIRYRAKHPVMSIYSDTLEKSVPDNLAIAVCAEAAWELLMSKRLNWWGDKTKVAMYNAIQKRADRARLENPIRIKPANRMPRINLSEL